MAKHQFQTEIGQLLKLMTHSLYSNKEIFIRELVSNASDAIDKFNYLSLTNESFKEENWSGKIFIKLDKEDNSLTISDNGIGMNEADLMDHLGTIAKSGTKAFMENLTGDAKKDSNLIGQFGVGFYSVFMVADHVDVISKKAGEEQAYMFSTDGTGEYEIKPVTKEEHGTIIYIKLKDDEKEFLDKRKTEGVVKKYSNHIAYPIVLNYAAEETEGEGDEKVTKTVNKSEQINAATALWTLSKSDLKEEDYVEFYKTLAHGDDAPLAHLHNRVEGANEFTTLFYIPKKAPMDMYRSDYEAGVKLYVKRVFITDDSKELLPVYLRFVKGIIDSEDLPLNVSRELLQENRILANIKQNSTKKILQTIKKFNSEEMEIFTSQYNRMIKEGIYTDMVNRDLLLDIVRYKSSSQEGLVSFEEYISRADSEKKEIYYIVGENEKILRNSPLLEAYKKANIEVLIMDDKEVDELVAPMIGEYGEWSLSDITAIDAPDAKSKEEQEEISKEFKPLTDKIKAVLGDEIKEVKISTRLTTSPSCVLKDTSDPMASMVALFKQMGQSIPEIKLVLEINPEHEIIKKLDGLSDESLFADIAWILLDSAKLSEGLEPKDKGEFVSRITSLATKAL
ncbi:MAG TPA: molecular chaperone HtpG [Sulfurovum sp.]|jgi:molecular chaperone HtpG|nr:MAG: molecular chaperone HtpG [Sulfurovum sp. 35-42-20]OYZ25483.1 MAG: molecular chaperone HtpG [Sulfurovum sp. 16-42-52]OYZ48821.1 MAG: molecular chaperone HtpG [Sulfurovum sp. 24-42-9]OZA44647.1 MAG: molecular chaperone HtpG [Sulfurovum sp. 17-42-90]OZA59339.1 MAG: molecular chaperone HtpG [Sulfurovum sp. 39-42-12]HQS72097.1 molecular chaperone HtpG [Sulfurovum sp.]